MGYVHDTQMSKFLEANRAMKSAGTWTEKETATADVWCIERTAADGTFNLRIPVELEGNSDGKKGCRLEKISVWYVVKVAALDALAAKIYKVTMQGDGGELVAGSELAFGYDAGHDAANERVDVDEHVMTLTLEEPVWIGAGESVFVELAVDAAATSVFEYLGAKVDYTLRL